MKKDKLHTMYRYLMKKNDWCTADELAAYLHVSTRTIRNYIAELNASNDSDVSMLSSRKGYKWNPSAHTYDLYYQRNVNLKPDTPDSPDARAWYIIRKLILDNRSYDDLLNNLFVSEHTINNTINLVRSVVADYDIRLHIKRNRLSLSGDEINFRALSYKCIFMTTKINLITFDFVKKAFPEFNCSEISHLANRVITQNGLCFNGYFQNEFLILLLLQLMRISTGNEINKSNILLDGIYRFNDYQVASTLADELGKSYHQTYSFYERQYLTALLISKTTETGTAPKENIPDYFQLKQTTEHLLRLAGHCLNMDLTKDDFVQYVTAYLQRFIIRQRGRFENYAPVYDSIHESHPVIFDVCCYFLMFFCKTYQLKLNKNEIASLACIVYEYAKSIDFHFEPKVNCTLVCPTFGNYPKELVDLIESRLGDSITLYQIKEVVDSEDTFDESELVISIFSQKIAPHEVYISLYPRSADFRHIYTEIHKIKMNHYSEQLYQYFKTMIYTDTFEITKYSYRNKESVITHICNNVQKSGYANEGIKDWIIERECIDTSAFHNNIAIPHICEQVVCKPFVYVMLNEHPIPWGDTNVNMIVMIGACFGNMTTMQIIYDLCIKVFSYYKNINSTLNAHNLESFLNIIATLRLE